MNNFGSFELSAIVTHRRNFVIFPQFRKLFLMSIVLFIKNKGQKNFQNCLIQRFFCLSWKELWILILENLQKISGNLRSSNGISQSSKIIIINEAASLIPLPANSYAVILTPKVAVILKEGYEVSSLWSSMSMISAFMKESQRISLTPSTSWRHSEKLSHMNQKVSPYQKLTLPTSWFWTS